MNVSPRQMDLLTESSYAEKVAYVATLTPRDALRWDAHFESWAHKAQLPPGKEGWRTWLMMAGRGFGKTRAGAEWIEQLARSRPGVRIALVGASIEEARRIMVEGVSGVLSVARRNGSRVKWEPSIGRLTWSNGSQAQLFSGDSPDGLRGPEHDFAWCDELAKWRDREEAWDNLQLGLRRGPRPRALVTTTPRSIDLLRRIREQPWTVETNGRTDENINLDQQFVDIMLATYSGTRIGRQELNGELIDNVEGALWTRELIERCRAQAPAQLDRIVVAVDPPAGESASCDACGIVVAGKSVDVLLVNPDHWLQSCDDGALAAGENLAMIGGELIQFGEATPLGASRFRLSRLLRGRRASESAMGLHSVGEAFLMIDEQSIQRIELTPAQMGATITATPRGIADSGAGSAGLVVSGEALRPPSPVHLTTWTDGAGTLHCRWCRRSRLGWAWIDGVDAPLGVSVELYRIALQSSGSAIEVETSAPEASFTAAQVASIGGGPLTLSVVQVGDLAVSRPATLNVN